MKRIIALILVIAFALACVACGANSQNETREEKAEAEIEGTEGIESHMYGVIVYNITDEEVVSFKNYLEGYIASVFPGTTFLYSSSITTEDEEMQFMQDAIEQGVEGFLSFKSMNLADEVALCAENGVYYVRAAGTVAEEDFAIVEDNPYFLGVMGPGVEMEYEAGVEMAQFFAENKYGDSYFVLSGGAPLGNEMHLRRTVGVLDQLQESYGVTFDESSLEIALNEETQVLNAGKLTVTVVPGFIAREAYLEKANEVYANGQYDVVLAVLPLASFAESIDSSKAGVIDCYSTSNLQLFTNGTLCYLTGKYSSIIGPTFAAMYNAVTGYANDFREDGKAFKIKQGFWTSTSYEDYLEKYTLANSVVSNAYNYEDLNRVCKVYNPDATLEDLTTLSEAYTYEDALLRRAE